MRDKIDNRDKWRQLSMSHPLESHDPEKWLLYGIALLQTMEPGPSVGKKLQQAALAFVQSQKEGASAESVARAQQHSFLISLEEAFKLAGIDLTKAPDTLTAAPRDNSAPSIISLPRQSNM